MLHPQVVAGARSLLARAAPAKDPLSTLRGAAAVVDALGMLLDVDEGGGTYFPYINITVKPKRGSAVWWPHGKPTNPRAKDDRTHHEAQPVIVGKKYAANYWIHGDDFKNAMASACDGRSGVKARAPPRLRPK